MQSKSKITVAVAGAGKTTAIVNDLSNHTGRRSALVTYTLNGADSLRECCYRTLGAIPDGCVISTWYSFLLSHFIRPYQNFLITKEVKSICFDEISLIARIASKRHAERFYLTSDKRIWVDRASDFACLANDRSGGLSVSRIKKIYNRLYIDEAQDLSGWDLELIETLLRSGVQMSLVSDPFQSTYATNRNSKNSGYAGGNRPVNYAVWSF